MSNSYFQFKQFTVWHDKCAMKVGADGVTLGAWADVSDVKSVLDIGCGSGLIALMIAQRSEAGITAIDIDGQSIEQTKENTGNSPWSERIKTVHASLQQFAANSDVLFDLIVCNPPYFNNSLKSPSESRTMARHTDTLSYTDLITNAGKASSNLRIKCISRKCQSDFLRFVKQLFCYPTVTKHSVDVSL